jgi:DNA-binding transcriptional ArsR family regulator
MHPRHHQVFGPTVAGAAMSEATLTRIRSIIAPWYASKSGDRYVLSVGDDGSLRLHVSDESILHEAESAGAMLDWVVKVNAWLEARINCPSTTNSPARGRGRPLSPEVTERRRRLIEMAREFQPATIRQLYYQAEVAGLVPKTDAGYRAVQHDLLVLRQQGVVEYDWISDNSRWMRKSRSYRGIDHFLNLSISTYRRDLWHNADAYVEIWIEKDALAGTVLSETNPYDVPLMVAKGFSSETYLYEAAQAIAAKGKPAYVYAFFDHDPSGKHSAKHIERKLREFAPDAEIHFELVAVTEQQIKEWNLPTRETKRGDNRHAKNFEGDSCELDSIRPDLLRDLVRERIERHVDQDSLATLQAAEKSERGALEMFAESWRGRP